MPALRRPVVLLAVVALVSGLAGCSDTSVADDPGRPPRVGESLVAQLTQDIEGFPTSIVVPGRRYDLVVTSPRERLDSLTAGEAGVREEGGDDIRFVAVTWDRSAAGGDAQVLAGDGPEITPTLSLIADDETYEVGDLDEEGVHARWVVVPGDVDDIGVSLEYDGVTQTVEDVSDPVDAMPVGGPELLYAEDPPGLHDPECPEPADDPEPASYVFGGCFVQVTDPFPYHREMRWADEGQAWVVVRLDVDPVVVGWDDPGEGGAVVSYEVDPEPVEVTLDGADSVGIFPLEPEEQPGIQDDGSYSGLVVFSVAADVEEYELAFERPYTARPDDPDEAAAEGTPPVLIGTYRATFPIEVR